MGNERDIPGRGAEVSRHVEAILDMAAKAFRMGQVNLSRDMLGHLVKERLTPAQAARRDRAYQLLADCER